MRLLIVSLCLVFLVGCGPSPSKAEVSCVTVYPPTTSATWPSGGIKPYNPSYDPDPHIHCFDGEGRLISVDGKPMTSEGE